MLARVKQDYAAGSVMAFSGREYVRSEWREVPAGFEEQAKNHPLLDTQPSLDEVRKGGTMAPGLKADEPKEPTALETAVTVETTEPPATEEPASASEEEHKTPCRRKRAAED